MLNNFEKYTYEDPETSERVESGSLYLDATSEPQM